MNSNKIIDVINLFSPFILVSLLIFMSVYHQDLKALTMLGGLLIAIYVLKQTSNNFEELSDESLIYCTMFNVYETPGTSTIIISYVFMYLLLPMIFNNQYNPLLLLVLGLMYIVDIYYKQFRYKCYSVITLIIATIIGLSFACGYFFMIYSLGENFYNLLYFNVSKNNLVQCERANKTEYQCHFEDDEGNVVSK